MTHSDRPLRARCYIDYFNLWYSALKTTPHLRWLDLQRFAQSVAPRNLEIDKVRVFTAKVPPTPRNRHAPLVQQIYHSALQQHCPNVELHLGRFLRHQRMAETVDPPGGSVRIYRTEEKGSDVALACHLLRDSWQDEIDVAVVITNDSDLAPAMAMARERGTKICWVPSMLDGAEHAIEDSKRLVPSCMLAPLADWTRRIRSNSLVAAQLPDIIPRANGSFISRPRQWGGTVCPAPVSRAVQPNEEAEEELAPR